MGRNPPSRLAEIGSDHLFKCCHGVGCRNATIGRYRVRSGRCADIVDLSLMIFLDHTGRVTASPL